MNVPPTYTLRNTMPARTPTSAPNWLTGSPAKGLVPYPAVAATSRSSGPDANASREAQRAPAAAAAVTAKGLQGIRRCTIEPFRQAGRAVCVSKCLAARTEVPFRKSSRQVYAMAISTKARASSKRSPSLPEGLVPDPEPIRPESPRAMEGAANHLNSLPEGERERGHRPGGETGGQKRRRVLGRTIAAGRMSACEHSSGFFNSKASQTPAWSATRSK